MRYAIWFVLAGLLCGFLAFAVSGVSATGAIQVDESAIRLTPHNQQVELYLAVTNPTRQSIEAVVDAEVVTPDNTIRDQTKAQTVLKPGKSLLRLKFDRSWFAPDAPNSIQFLLDRVRYRVTPAAKPVTAAQGIVSVSEIMPDAFSLQVRVPEFAPVGGKYLALVEAVHPVTGRIVPWVALGARLTIKNQTGEVVKSARAETGSEGTAILKFELPTIDPTDDVNITVAGSKNGWTQTTEQNLEPNRETTLLLHTDKPLYQPKQTVHLRVLVFNAAKQAAAGAVVQFQVEDPNSETVFEKEATTSRFGVATVDWEIPENQRSGEYAILARFPDGSPLSGIASVPVKISRYELPTFVVAAETNQPFYLPGESATVTVQATYLFGQPVKQGQVRVVREVERSWDYERQKWDVTEGEPVTGLTDSQGRFQTVIDLTQVHEELRSDRESIRDATYRAYFTDASTGRTEQGRFAIRVSQTSLQVKIFDWHHPAVVGMPYTFYVLTELAEGKAVPTTVDVVRQTQPASTAEDQPQKPRRAKTLRTNQLGLLKIEIPAKDVTGDELVFDLTIRDQAGHKTQTTHRVELKDEPALMLQGKQTLYHPGEDITATLFAHNQNGQVLVSVVSAGRVLASQTIQAGNSPRLIRFPYRPEFNGVLKLVAASTQPTESGDLIDSHRVVIYPQSQRLNVKVNSDRKIYAPGADGTLQVDVRTAGNTPVESVLGVAMVDRAVQARLQSEFNPNLEFGFSESVNRWLGETLIDGKVDFHSLAQLDSSEPFPAGYDLLAEILGNQRYSPLSDFRHFGGSVLETQRLQQLFHESVSKSLEGFRTQIQQALISAENPPQNTAELVSFLESHSLGLDELKDPWGVPYRVSVRTFRGENNGSLVTNGPDKRPGTPDDFTAIEFDWPFFQATGKRIDQVVAQYHARTGGYIRDYETLKAELARQNMALDELRDPWGRPYCFTFSIERENYVISVRSRGEDGIEVDPQQSYGGDDFRVWTSRCNYFVDTWAKLEQAVGDVLPEIILASDKDQAFRAKLAAAGIVFDELRDLWESPLYLNFRHLELKPINDNKSGMPQMQVVYRYGTVSICSRGPNQVQGDADDFVLGILATRTATSQEGQSPDEKAPSENDTGTTGTLMGTVMDESGAVITDVKIEAIAKGTGQTFSTKTNENGQYFLVQLPPGWYEVNANAGGFQYVRYENVLLRGNRMTVANVTLVVGGSSELIIVSSGEVLVQTTNSESRVKIREEQPVASSVPVPLFTPRVRRYFPETLLWQPQVETDQSGRARLNFKLADNLTTWKLSVLASTFDGQLGVAEKEIQTFQPFFAELDPPRTLTVGDQITLPVIVRNYLKKKQNVTLELKPEDWFVTRDASSKNLDVAGQNEARRTFSFDVVKSSPTATQQVTATGTESSDAVEKPVTVQPDGEEQIQTDGQLFSDSVKFETLVPTTVLSGTLRSTLKLYPNLLGHVFEGIEGILQRPHGCAEQTISSTYPNVMVLKYLAQLEQPEAVTTQRARDYTQQGIDRLLGYQHETGGFTYWGSGSPDVTLTAYAIRFLTDAREFATVDESVIDRARSYILSQQQTDGSWAFDNRYSGPSQSVYNLQQSAYVALSLASSGEKSATFQKALDRLGSQIETSDSPYWLAVTALAASRAGQPDLAAQAVARLGKLIKPGTEQVSWNQSLETPFHGWGRAAEVETTALALRAILAVTGNVQASDWQSRFNRGLLYLLQNKDQHGVWLSTQASVAVWELLFALHEPEREARKTASSLEIWVNDQPFKTIELTGTENRWSPITVDLTERFAMGRNQVELRCPQPVALMSAQLMTSLYVPWTVEPGKVAQKSPDLNFDVTFDKTETVIGDVVTCRVGYERKDRGNGMLLAEIGLPPGVEVDRESLTQALRKQARGGQSFDIQPDRVVLYLWPWRNEKNTLEFTFRPRFAMKAKTVRSLLYDYYNPDAQVLIAPARFVVREK